MAKKKLTQLEKEFLKDKKRLEELIQKELGAFNDKYLKLGVLVIGAEGNRTKHKMDLIVACNRTKMYEFPELDKIFKDEYTTREEGRIL
ncbi:MAG TPA: hypothetical protein VF868_06520 [Bacteroidia bacterium]|jgi:hypothetical protein